MILPDDVFDFSYFFDLYQSLRELAQMAIPEAWKFHSPQTPTYNEETPILEKYIRSLYRYLAISYNTSNSQAEKNRYFSMNGPWACFHTGLMTPYFESIYALFELNRRRDTRYNWVFKSFCPASSVKLRGIAELPEKPSFMQENRYHPEWEIRINYQHILQDGVNLQRIPENIRQQKNLPLLLNASVQYSRALASLDSSIIVPQLYCRQIQFLMPICLSNMETCDLAMTLTPCDGFYFGTTCLTCEMAYINARILSRPSASWLTDLVGSGETKHRFDYRMIYGMYQQASQDTSISPSNPRS